jgi:2,4-dienoyl-CoA reductase-like NADH-dependent reductase (Old Yellow Enzyme family)
VAAVSRDRERLAFRRGYQAGKRAAERRHRTEIAEMIRALKHEVADLEIEAVVSDYARSVALAYEQRTDGVTVH